jgi:hypothetical protein
MLIMVFKSGPRYLRRTKKPNTAGYLVESTSAEACGRHFLFQAVYGNEKVLLQWLFRVFRSVTPRLFHISPCSLVASNLAYLGVLHLLYTQF